MSKKSLEFTFLREPKEEHLKVVSGDEVIFREPIGYVNSKEKEMWENKMGFAHEKIGEPPYKIKKISEDICSTRTTLLLIGKNGKTEEIQKEYLTKY